MIHRDISPIFSITLKREKYTGIKGNNEPVFKMYSTSFLMARVEMDFKLTKMDPVSLRSPLGPWKTLLNRITVCSVPLRNHLLSFSSYSRGIFCTRKGTNLLF